MHKVDYNTYRNRLEQLKDQHGEQVFHWWEEKQHGTITKLWDMGANLEELVRLFSYHSPDGCGKFGAVSTTFFLEHGGYSVADLIRVAELKDHLGNAILDSDNGLFEFMEIGGKVSDAEEIAGIRDSEGCVIYRVDTVNWGSFRGFEEITELLEAGGNAQKVRGLAGLRDDSGVSFFKTPRDINRFIEAGGSIEYAKEMMSIRDHRGKHIFDEFSLALFKEDGGIAAYAKELADLHDTEGQTVFSRGIDIRDYHYYHKEKGYGTALSLVHLNDTLGRTVFRDGCSIVDFLNSKGTVEKARGYLAIEGTSGNTHFRGDEIALLVEHSVPELYAKELAQQGVNAATIVYNYRAGLQRHDFQKNKRQRKALALYPTSDPPQFGRAGKAWTSDGGFAFLKLISDAYDLKIRAISSVEEMYHELDRSPELHLLILAGHGSPATLTFGESIPKYGISINDHSAKLSIRQKELSDHLKALAKDAVIFLNSCLNGAGRKSAENLANYMAACAPGRKVISCEKEFNPGSVEIRQTFPLKLRIRGRSSVDDCVYIAKQNILHEDRALLKRK